MTTVSATDILGNEAIREGLLQTLREDADSLGPQEKSQPAAQTTQDVVSISDEARRLLEEQKAAEALPRPESTPEETEKQPLVSGESSSGIRVDISRTQTDKGNNTNPTYQAVIGGKDGTSFTLDFSGTVSIAAGEDGIWSAYHADLGVTRHYSTDGSFTETSGNTLNPDSDLIVISTGQDSITLGEGDNTIFALGDGASITTGNGNNTVHVAGKNVSVTTGDGDDRVIVADNATGAVISTGNGHDSLKAGSLKNATIDLGDGDNTLQADAITASEISMGNGNNVITGSGSSFASIENSRVAIGDGNNTLRAGISGSVVTLGHGNNTVVLDDLRNGSSLTAGHGNNTISAAKWINDEPASIIEDSLLSLGNGTNAVVLGKASGSSIQMGNGDNLLSLSEAKNSLIMLGDGDNAISIHGIATGDSTLANSYLSWGKGNTTLVLGRNSMSSIVGGDGNNEIAIGVVINGNLALGNGDNDISVTLADGNSTLVAGDGQNHFYLNRMEGNAVASAGDGNNSLFVSTMQESSGLTVGDGNNFILVTEMKDNAYIKTGNGRNIIRVLSAMETVSVEIDEASGYNGTLVNYTYQDVMRNAASNLTGSGNASLEDLLAAAVDKLEQQRSERRAETMSAIATTRSPASISERTEAAVQQASEASQKAVERAEAA